MSTLLGNTWPCAQSVFAPWQALSNANEVLRNTLATISEKPGALELFCGWMKQNWQKKHRFLRTFGGIWVDFVWNVELSDVEVHFRGPHMRGASVRILIRNIPKGLGEQIGWHAFCRLHFSSSSRCTAMSQTCIQLSNSLAEHGLKFR